MTYQNLIFDLDGTLVDSLRGIHSSMQVAIDQVLPGEKMPEMRKVVGPPLHQMFQKMWPQLSVEKVEELVREFRKDYDLNGFSYSELYPEVLEVLSELKQSGKKLYLLTNKPLVPTTHILKHLKLDNLFIDSMSPDSLNPPFTEKATGLHELIRRHQMDVKSSVMIGDSIDDALAARATGTDFIAADFGYGEVLKHPEFAGAKKIQSLEEIGNCLVEGKLF